jgi:glutathione reductase (NADPH)
MEQIFDLVVLGAGSGGLAAAKRAARYGAKVAIVEGDRVGGTCVIRGCVPKKLLVYGSLLSEQLEGASSYGVSVAGATFDTSVLLRNVRHEVDRLNALHIDFLAKAGVELITGWGRFLDPHRIGVSKAREGEIDQVLQAKRVMIAVGGRPFRPNIPGAELAWVSDDMFLQQRFPDRVVVVGAGFIACEFAGILRGLGVAVTQLVRGEQLLRGFDSELSGVVQDGMQSKGIDLRFGKGLAAIEGQSNDSAGVVVEGHRIPVDADQVTNLPHVFAVGDVTDRICLTPVAVDEGRAFADSVFGSTPRQVNHNLVASAVFSQPELATVGLSEEAAIAKLGADQVVVHRARFRSMAQALPQHGPRCLLKLVLEVSSGKVLGCHMVGEHAAEIIQMAAIAVGMGATKADFDRTMALHPTVSEEFVTMA